MIYLRDGGKREHLHSIPGSPPWMPTMATQSWQTGIGRAARLKPRRLIQDAGAPVSISITRPNILSWYTHKQNEIHAYFFLQHVFSTGHGQNVFFKYPE